MTIWQKRRKCRLAIQVFTLGADTLDFELRRLMWGFLAVACQQPVRLFLNATCQQCSGC